MQWIAGVGVVLLALSPPYPAFGSDETLPNRPRVENPNLHLVAEVQGAFRRGYVDPVEDATLAAACREGIVKWSRSKGRAEPAVAARSTALEEVAAAFSLYELAPNDSLAVQIAEECIKEMVNAIDRDGEFLGREAFRHLVRPGETGAVGLEFTSEANSAVVVSPIPGAPAERAGIRPGDRLIKIDDKSLSGLSLDEVVKLTRGPPGSTVRITLMRADRAEPEITLTRAVIRIQSVTSVIRAEGHLHVRISRFSEATAELLAKALASFVIRSRDSDGVVLDLRNNSGGLLYSCIEVAAAFLPPNAPVVQLRGRTSQDSRLFRTAPDDYVRKPAKDPLAIMGNRVVGVPLAVLVNKRTGGCAEFVAAALQDNGRARVVGDRTSGRGSVQTIFPLSDKSTALKLTTARYFRTNGGALDSVGVSPDVPVPDDSKSVPPIGAPVDTTLSKAVSELRTAAGPAPTAVSALEDHKRCREAYSARDWANALALCRPLAERGDSVAQVILGFMLANAQGVAQDDGAAAKWFRLSAEQGNPLGQTMLGSMYGAGDGGLPRNPVEAVRLYTLAANQGLPNGQFYLATAYLRGFGVTKDPALGASWLRRAAEQGFPYAQAYLGLAYRDGIGVPKDDLLCYFWLTIAKRDMVAEKGSDVERVHEEVASRLTPQQRNEAIDLADKWRPKLESPAPRQ